MTRPASFHISCIRLIKFYWVHLCTSQTIYFSWSSLPPSSPIQTVATVTHQSIFHTAAVIFIKRKYDYIFAVHIEFNGSSLPLGSNSKHLTWFKIFLWSNELSAPLTCNTLSCSWVLPHLNSFCPEHFQTSNYLLINAHLLFMSLLNKTSQHNCSMCFNALMQPYQEDTITNFIVQRWKLRHWELNNLLKVPKLNLRFFLHYLFQPQAENLVFVFVFSLTLTTLIWSNSQSCWLYLQSRSSIWPRLTTSPIILVQDILISYLSYGQQSPNFEASLITFLPLYSLFSRWVPATNALKHQSAAFPLLKILQKLSHQEMAKSLTQYNVRKPPISVVSIWPNFTLFTVLQPLWSPC